MRRLLVIAIAVTATGCIVGPNYVKPTTPVAPSFKEPLPPYFKEADGWKAGEPRDDLHKGKWWEVFGDPELNALEEQIDAANQQLAAAEAQYRGARAAIRVARSGLYPTLTAGAGVSGAGTSGALGQGSARQSALLTIPTVGASWEPDFFGGVHRSIESAVNTAQATAADLETTRLLLETELALDYFQIHGLDAEKQLLDSTVKDYARALDLTNNRYNQGVASQVDVAQAQTQLAQTQAQATDTTVARQQFEHAIAILLGKPPSEFSIAVTPIKSDLPAIPGVIPSELLERRPDVAANERRVAAANAQIGVAIAAYYPNITLSAGGGFETSSLLSLFTWPSRFWSVGPSISQLFLDGGRRRGVTEQAQAAYDVTVANYRQSVLTAFQNVEDNLAALRILEQEAREQTQAVGYATRSLQLANAQYTGGITTYLQVITAEEIALSNQVTEVQLKTRRMMASVSLIQAIGGGWDSSQIPTPKEVTPQKVTRPSTTK